MLRRFPAILLPLLLIVTLSGCVDATDIPTAATLPAPSGTPVMPEETGLDLFSFPTATAIQEEEVYHEGVWDSALLPSDFPAPIPVADTRWTMYTPARGGADAVWSLALSLTASQWDALNDAFTAAGWVGGGSDVAATGDTLLDGAWVSDGYYAAVYRADYAPQSRLYAVELQIMRRKPTDTPADLSVYFPLFTAGYSPSGCRAQTEDDGTCTWIYGGSGRLCGVSETAVSAYRRVLLDSGFVEAAAPTITGIVGWAVTRDEETQQLRVEGLYDPACATLELVYTRLPAAS